MNKAIDLTGRRFGKLLVQHRDKSPNADEHAYWRCRCDCGGTTLTSGVSLLSGTRSCKPCSQIPKNAVWQQVYGLYRRNAKHRGHAFELSGVQFAGLIVSACDYCGAAPAQKLWQGRKSAAHVAFRWNGVDRVNSGKGYVEGNCVPCCKPCNEMKSDRSREEFLRMIEAIYRHRIGRSTTAGRIIP